MQANLALLRFDAVLGNPQLRTSETVSSSSHLAKSLVVGIVVTIPP
jgi:hypothetical protein